MFSNIPEFDGVQDRSIIEQLMVKILKPIGRDIQLPDFKKDPDVMGTFAKIFFNDRYAFKFFLNEKFEINCRGELKLILEDGAQDPLGKTWVHENYLSMFASDFMMSMMAGMMKKFSCSFFGITSVFIWYNTPVLVMPRYNMTFNDLVRSKLDNKHDHNYIMYFILHAIFVMQSFAVSHRDLKTTNIFLELVDDNTMVNGQRLSSFEFIELDFGIARKVFKRSDIKYIPKIGDWGISTCSLPNYKIEGECAKLPVSFRPHTDLMCLTYYTAEYDFKDLLLRWLVPEDTQEYKIESGVIKYNNEFSVNHIYYQNYASDIFKERYPVDLLMAMKSKGLLTNDVYANTLTVARLPRPGESPINTFDKSTYSKYIRPYKLST